MTDYETMVKLELLLVSIGHDLLKKTIPNIYYTNQKMPDMSK